MTGAGGEGPSPRTRSAVADVADVAEETDARAATRLRILKAAEQCMARIGLQRFSMNDVAQQAGLSRGAIYLHFADRAALVDAVLARFAIRFVASSEEAVRQHRTLADQVAEAAVFIRAHLGDRSMTLELPSDEGNVIATMMALRIDRLVEDWIEFWVPYLVEAERRGEVRAGLDRRHAAEWIVRIMLTFTIMPSPSFDSDDPAAVRAFVRAYIVNGFAP